MTLHFKVSDKDRVLTGGRASEGRNIHHETTDVVSCRLRVNRPLELRDPSVMRASWDRTGSPAGLVNVMKEVWEPKLRTVPYGYSDQETVVEMCHVDDIIERAVPVLGEETRTLIHDTRYTTGHDGSTPLDHLRKLSGRVSDMVPKSVSSLVSQLNNG